MLNETNPFLVQGLNCKTVLTGKQSRYQESPEPTNLAIRLNIDHFRFKGHRSPSWGLKPDLKMRPSPNLATHQSNKRVPLGKLGKISQDLPDTFRRGLNLDFSRNFFHT